MQTDNHRLPKIFRPLSSYQHERYGLLPFKLILLNDARYLLINIAGDYVSLGRNDVESLVQYKLPRAHPQYNELRARHFVYEGDPSLSLELLATQYRTKQAHLAEFTALHIFVVSLRCDHSCHYCQVSRVSQDRLAYDMSRETASKAVDLMRKSPSRYLKVEFQGGEPLLNFEVIQHIVHQVEEKASDRTVEFVIASNLSFLTDEMLDFALAHRLRFSCSFAGWPGRSS